MIDIRASLGGARTLPTNTRLASLLLTALNLGPAYGHLLEMGPKRAMSGPEWLITQQAYRDFGRVAGVTFPAGLLAILTDLALSRHRPREAGLTALAAGCEVATVGIWARFNEPVNREVVDWDSANLPGNWADRRDQWEFAHATSAVLHTAAFISLLIAALFGHQRSWADWVRRGLAGRR